MSKNKDFHNSFPLFSPDTLAAIKEAEQGEYAGTIDVTSFSAFMDSINKIE